jgi:hypothetical protein
MKGSGGFNPNDVVHSFYKGVVNTQTNSLNQSANVQEKLTLMKAPPNDLRSLNFTNGQLSINQNTQRSKPPSTHDLIAHQIGSSGANFFQTLMATSNNNGPGPGGGSLESTQRNLPLQKMSSQVENSKLITDRAPGTHQVKKRKSLKIASSKQDQ